MKKRLLALLLCLVLCFTTVFVSIAAANTSSKVTVSVKDLKPGYYLGAIWDGDELLTLFDYTAGSDGKLETVVDVGKTFPDGKQLKIGLSSENAGGTAIPPIIYTIGSDTTPTASPSPAPSQSAAPTPTPSQAPSSQPSTSPTPSPNTPDTSYYAIYIPATVGGWVSATHSNAAPGTIVSITLTPHSNYDLGAVYVTDGYGRSVSLTWQSNNSYRFVMPYSTVTISASFTRRYTPGITNPGNASSSAREYMSRWRYNGGAIVDSISGIVTPNDNLSRDVLVSVLYNLDGQTQDKPTIWAARNGIVKNYMESGLQGPDMAITKDQIAYVLYNFAQYQGIGVSARASNVTTSRSITRTAYSWANAVGLFNGVPGGANATVTCNQAAIILRQFCENVLR